MATTPRSELETRLRTAVAELPQRLRGHIARVEAEAVELARLHAVDEEQARLAALGHDLLRHLGDDGWLELASSQRREPDDVERASPILLHGPLAALLLRERFEVVDEELLAGIDCHTTARVGMTALEQVLFVADKVEPHKLEREASLAEVKQLAQADLDAAVLRYLDFNLEQALLRGWQVHPRSNEARNELLGRRG